MIILGVILLSLPLCKMLEGSSEEEKEEEPTRVTRFARWLRKQMLWGFTLRFVLQ
jgi:hypothetical protein